MRRSRLKAPLVLLGLACCVVGALAVAGSEPEVRLRWALGARDADNAEVRAINEDTELPTGTQLKFLVEPLAPGALYLILLDSSDELHVLYRAWTPVGEDGGRSYIPPGPQWFAVDEHSGMETFFLIASRDRLTDLDRLLDEYEAADEAGRDALGPEVVAEIRRQHKAHRDFSRPVSKPVMIGGRTRGETAVDETAIDYLATEVTAEQFYAKTITIDH